MIEIWMNLHLLFNNSLQQMIGFLLLFTLKQESRHLFRLNSHLTKHNKN